MNYLDNIKVSLKFILAHPKTWVLGFIITLSTGITAGFNSNISGEAFYSLISDATDKIKLRLDRGDLKFSILFFVMFIVVVLLFQFIVILAKANLIKLFQNRQNKKFSFKQVLFGGRRYIGRLFLLDLLIILSIVLVSFVLLLVIGTITMPFIIFFVPILCVISIVLFVVLAGTYTNAQRLIVLDQTKSVFRSLKEGKRLFVKNFGKYLVSALIFNGLGCIWQFFIVIPLVIMMIFLSSKYVLGLYSNGMSPELALLIFIIINTVFYAVVQGIYKALSYTYWTKVVIDILNLDKESNKKSK